MENTTTSCSICDEKFDKKKRTKITCSFCSFETCRTCSEKYILSNTSLNVCCMNPSCKKEWTRYFIRSVFTFVFISGEFKKHREQILFEQERALLPATQVLIEEENRTKQTKKELEKIQKEINILRQQQIILRNTLYTRRQPQQTAVFIRGCSDPECRGFLNTNWKCGICEKTTCSKCHEVVVSNDDGDATEEEHTCDQEKVATAELIVSETKPCPNCRTNIFKIDGCNQMWCTQCHTAFDWRTGRIETTTIHNPHYYEWLRRNNNGVIPRNPGDNPCVEAQIINHGFLVNFKGALQTKRQSREFIQKIYDKLSDIVRNLIHLRLIDITKYEYNHVNNNQSLRMCYMKNKITEERFKVLLQQNDKRNQKHLEIRNILQLLIETVSEILVRTYGNIVSSTPALINESMIDKTLDELPNIINYTNECLAEIAKTYNSKKIEYDNKLKQIIIRKPPGIHPSRRENV
jgi:hypothetical protein